LWHIIEKREDILPTEVGTWERPLKNKKNKGINAFDEFYRDTFKERWPKLKESFLAAKKYLAFQLNGETKEASFFDPPLVLDSGLKNYYIMDPASYFAAYELAALPGERVLDMCAAPGGKTLVLASKLSAKDSLVANERSAPRRNRLINTIKDYIGETSQIKVTGHDATKWCLYEKEAYDKILLDVPCSSERHLLEKPSLLKDWKPARSKKLAITQWTLLAGAFEVLKPGGFLMYSTCSISSLENDEVIRKLLKKYSNAEVKKIDLAEKTEFGQIFLPDTSGYGPLYFTLINKKAEA
jgi:16S rRNA C967 or C1407 C5-methylase (RsmB/RsmF family)